MSEETLQLIAEHPYFVELEDRVRRLEEAVKLLSQGYLVAKYFIKKYWELPL